MVYGITKESQIVDKGKVHSYCETLKTRASELETYANNIGKAASDITENVLSIGGKTPGGAFDEVVEYLKSQASALIEYAEAAEERVDEIYSAQYAEYTDYKNRNTNTVSVSSSTASYSGNDVTNTVGGNSTNTVGNTVN